MSSLSSKIGSIKLVPSPQSPASAGFIQAFAGSTAPQGWALCDGAVLEQADYPDLFAALGSNWDAFAHPVDGAPTVGGSQFALPNLKGLYLAMAGDSGGDARTLGVFQDDATDQNGLTVSGGTASGTFASSSHTHSDGSLYAEIGYDQGDGSVLGHRNDKGGTFTSALDRDATNSSAGPTVCGRTDVHGTSGGPSATASVSNTPASVSASDAETRPKTAPINYIIKLYSDKANAVAVGLDKAELWGVGDVKHSMLTEPQFQTQFGTSWVLMDGRDVTGSAYHELTGSANVPDAAGRFLRMAGGDAAALGSQQDDATAVNELSVTSAGAHTHPDNISANQSGHSHGPGAGNNFVVTGAGGSAFLQGSGTTACNITASTNSSDPGITVSGGVLSDGDHSHPLTGAVETRPVNVTVNYFVKIN